MTDEWNNVPRTPEPQRPELDPQVNTPAVESSPLPIFPEAAPAPAATPATTPAPALTVEPAHVPAHAAEPSTTMPAVEHVPAHSLTPATEPSTTAPAVEPAPTPAPASAPAPAPTPTAEISMDLPDPTAPVSPEDTAEIDVKLVEAKLNDPGSTQSFAPITDDLINTDATFDAGTSAALMWGARSDVGCVRNHNEDSYLVAPPLFCVCDGMGGHAAGEVASAIAVETIASVAPKSTDAAQLGAAIEAANAAIIEAALNGVGRPGMGCTATAAYIEGTTLAVAHVGDSRAYLLHEGTLIRVTRDHSYVEELVDAGEITADEARVHPNRSVITRALGSDPAMYADHFTLNIEEGDRLILCSDGLSSMITDGEIEHIATKSSTAQICTDNLVDAALAAGGSDNVTVLVIDITDDGRARELRKKHRRNAIAIVVALLVTVAIAAFIAFMSITNSVYLGVKDDAVAIYKGVPNDFAGLKLHWLEDETSVLLKDLPVDTQNRLREGIPQESLEVATETVSRYRKQIDEEQSKQAEDGEAIRQSLDASASADTSTDTPADGLAASDPAGAVAATDPSTEGGAA